MRISNKKIDKALNLLVTITGGQSSYDLRTDNTRPDMGCGKYSLYMIIDKYGYALPGTYGQRIRGFKSQKDFINWVNNLAGGQNNE